ncbi:hypothetical protein [Frankia sp. KB5]|uniref:hypothetical protein n=1 Tax=Frankia sp. KB5 TaxID=683318 RepID=UPI000A0FA3EB|nr:hypothetical protein [Frankia sp. KB5]ORT53031.1 hypothetical protein KBI5_08715 [Frankia sp. KB5]
MTTCWAVGTPGPGAPGATTMTLALAAVGGGVVVEAGTDGGVLAARCALSLAEGAPGLASLVVAAAHGPLDVLDHAQRCAGGVSVIAAATTEETVAGALRGLTNALPRLRREQTTPLLLDVGRVRQASAALLSSCDGLILVTEASREALACALVRLPDLFAFARRIVLVVRDCGHYALGDVRRLVDERVGVAGVPVLAVPDDPRSAQSLVEGGRFRRRAPLLLAADQILDACDTIGADGLPAEAVR